MNGVEMDEELQELSWQVSPEVEINESLSDEEFAGQSLEQIGELDWAITTEIISAQDNGDISTTEAYKLLGDVQTATDGALEYVEDITPLPIRLKIKEKFRSLNPLNRQREKRLAEMGLRNDRSEPGVTLEPLRRVTVDDGYNVRDFSEEVDKIFMHYAKTGEPEINTDRTRLLQDLLDKMTEGDGVRTRVVILRRGKEPNAFVTPEGTIFVTQSLINMMEWDELGAVLAHEAGHVIHKTFEKKVKADYSAKPSVGWVHEMAGDVTTPFLLEKAGLNSMAFSSAIMKLSSGQRGIEHMSGETRAAQAMGVHFGMDMESSNVPMTPLPEILRGEVRLTNMDVVTQLMKKGKIEELITALPQLEPEDFHDVFFNIGFAEMSDRKKYRVMEAFYEEVSHRLDQSGYDEDTKLALRALVYADTPGWVRPNGYRQPEDVVKASGAVMRLDNANTFKGIYKELFGITPRESPVNIFFDDFKNHFTDIHFEKAKKDSLPITEKSLFEILKNAHEIKHDDQELEKYTATLLVSYYRTYHTDIKSGAEPDGKAFDDWLKSAETYGVPVERNTIWKTLTAKGLRGRAPDSPEEEEYWRKFQQQLVELWRNDEIKGSIDTHIEEFFGEKLGDRMAFNEQLNYFYSSTRAYLDRTGADNQERLRVARLVKQHMDVNRFRFDFPARDVFQKIYSFWDRDEQSRGDTLPNRDLDQKMLAIHINSLAGISFFTEDSEEFYTYAHEVMTQYEPFAGEVSYQELLNVSRTWFLPMESKRDYRGGISIPTIGKNSPWKTETGYLSLHGSVVIKDWDKLLDLPFIKKISDEAKGQVQAGNLAELLKKIKQLDEDSLSFGAMRFNKGRDWYESDMVGLIVGEPIRQQFKDMTSDILTLDELTSLQTFIENYFPANDIQRDAFIRRIDAIYLKNSDLSLDEKMEYVVKHFDRIGPEGMIQLAEEIDDPHDYERFREKMLPKIEDYLNGSPKTSAMAAVDVASAFLINDPEKVFESTMLGEKEEKAATTKLAKNWVKAIFHPEWSTPFFGLSYDKERHRFTVDSKQRGFFKSFNDLVTTLNNLSAAERLAFAQKALTERDGALTSDAKRKALARSVTVSLELDGFAEKALEGALLTADAELISVPIARSMAPLLFRSLKMDRLDYGELGRQVVGYGDGVLGGWYRQKIRLRDNFENGGLEEFMQAKTRNILQYGSEYSGQPDSLMAQKSQASNEIYEETLKQVDHILKTFEGNGEVKAQTEQKKVGKEAIITGVQATGPVGVRGLQLASQFYRFDEETSKQVAEAFDSNHGLNKLLFWENIWRLKEKEPSVKEFLDNLVSLDEYLGGGSLYTTYGAVIRTDEGEKEVVFKMLNPNAAAFVEKTYQTGVVALEYVKKKHGKKYRNMAETAHSIIDLSHQWCLKDISDGVFVEQDRQFRLAVDEYNMLNPDTPFDVPAVYFYSPKLKCEERAMGQTINRRINTGELSQDELKGILTMKGKFMLHQLRRKPQNDGHGKEVLIFHSDPSIGNYQENQGRLAVLDRNMYLPLTPEDAQVAEALIKGDEREFLHLLIERVLDVNKIRQVSDRKRIRRDVLGAVAKEYVTTKLKGLDLDSSHLLSTVLTRLSNASPGRGGDGNNMQVPLELRLLIRDIEAEKELLGRYGINLSGL